MSEMPSKAHFKKLAQVAMLVIVLLYTFSSVEIREKIAGRFIASSVNRSPSSIQKVFDFSYLQGSALQAAAKERLSSSIYISTSEDKSKVTITMGNFVLKNDQDERDFACGFYDRITFLFEAEGIAIDGEKPKLIITSGCEVGSNINYLNPIDIPVEKLRQQALSNTEFKFFESHQSTTIQLIESPPAWPQKWVLKEVKMAHSRVSSRVLNLSPSDWNTDGNHSLTMNW